jgi:hypothetical protein
MQHFRGGMDHWDPAVTDGFAKDRPVILFDNAGVASSSGETPENTNARPQSPSYGRLQNRALASIFSGSFANLSPKDTTERTFRSVSNG